MTAQRFFKMTLSLAAAGLLLLAVLTAAVDPFCRYHLPWFGLPVQYDNEYYQSPGLARRLPYDAAIVGTSVTQNFRAGEADGIFGERTAKLTLAGGTVTQFAALLRIALETHGLRSVLFGYDWDMLVLPYGTETHARPAYLWNAPGLGDAAYLWNRDVLLGAIPAYLSAAAAGSVPPLDEANAWDKEAVFSKAEALLHYARPGESAAQLPTDAFLESARENTAALCALFSEHPETTFYVFYPPYSVLRFDAWKRSGSFDAMLGALREASALLLRQENVRLFNFYGMMDVTGDLGRYRDPVHYDAAVNRAMLRCMADGRFEMTEETYGAQLDALAAFARDYAYERVFSEDAPATGGSAEP